MSRAADSHRSDHMDPANPLARMIASWERRRRLLILARAACEAAALAGAGIGVIAVVDGLLVVDDPLRAVARGIAWGGAALWLGARGLWPWLQPRSLLAGAMDLQQRLGWSHDALSGPIQLSAGPPPGTSPWMAQRAVALATHDLAQADIRRLLRHWPLTRAGLTMGAMGLILVGGALWPGGSVLLSRALWSGPGAQHPDLARIELGEQERIVAVGAGIELVASADRPCPDMTAVLVFADGRQHSVAMTGDGRRFTAAIPAILDAFHWHARCGRAVSNGQRIRAVEPPRIAAVELMVTPPAYAGLPSRLVSGGDTEVIQGSRIVVRCTLAGAPAVVGSLVIGDGQALPLDFALGQGASTAIARLAPATEVVWGTRLVASVGDGSVIGDSGLRWRIGVVSDRGPLVSLDGGGGLVDTERPLALHLRAEDDLGLRSLLIRWVTDAGEQGTLPVPLPVPMTAARLQDHVLDFSTGPLLLTPGDGFTLVAEAMDSAGATGRSRPLRLRASGREAVAAGLTAAAARRAADMIAALVQDRRTLATSISIALRSGQIASAGERQLARDRLDAWTSQAHLAAERAATVPGDTPAARLSRAMAGPAQAWASAERERIAAAIADGSGERLSSGRSVDGDGEALLRDSRTAADLAHADSLAAQAATTHVAAGRAGERLRAAAAWAGEGWLPGLRAVWYRGTGFERRITSTTGLPEIADPAAPDGVKKNWSVHWEGEWLPPRSGRQPVTATADDGVRLRLAGQDQFPVEAWRGQFPTVWRAEPELDRVWTPIRIDFFQVEGPATLAIDDQVGRLGFDRLRCSPSQVLTAEMTALGVDSDTAARAMVDALTTLAGLPASAAVIAPTQAAVLDVVAAEALRLAAATAPWTLTRIDTATRVATRLGAGLLPGKGLVDEVKAALARRGEVAKDPLLAGLDMIQARIDEAKRATRQAQLDAEEREAAITRAMQAAQIQAAGLATAAAQRAAALRQEALSGQASAAQRINAVLAARAMDRTRAASATLTAGLAPLTTERIRTLEQAVRATGILALDAVRQATRLEVNRAEAEAARLAPLAQTLATAQLDGDVLTADHWARVLAHDLGQALNTGGHAAMDAESRKAFADLATLAQRGALAPGSELASRLEQMGRSADRLLAKTVQTATEAADQEHPQREQDLAAIAAAVRMSTAGGPDQATTGSDASNPLQALAEVTAQAALDAHPATAATRREAAMAALTSAADIPPAEETGKEPHPDGPEATARADRGTAVPVTNAVERIRERVSQDLAAARNRIVSVDPGAAAELDVIAQRPAGEEAQQALALRTLADHLRRLANHEARAVLVRNDVARAARGTAAALAAARIAAAGERLEMALGERHRPAQPPAGPGSAPVPSPTSLSATSGAVAERAAILAGQEMLAASNTAIKALVLADKQASLVALTADTAAWGHAANADPRQAGLALAMEKAALANDHARESVDKALSAHARAVALVSALPEPRRTLVGDVVSADLARLAAQVRLTAERISGDQALNDESTATGAMAVTQAQRTVLARAQDNPLATQTAAQAGVIAANRELPVDAAGSPQTAPETALQEATRQAARQALATLGREPDRTTWQLAAVQVSRAAARHAGLAALATMTSAPSTSPDAAAADGPGQVDLLGSGDPADQGTAGIDDQAAWGRLNQRERSEVAAGSVERFAEDQQEAIRAYLRRLQEER